MSKGSSFFSQIDEFIFHKLDYLKNEGIFQKINDLLSALEEQQKKTALQIITFLFLFFPFVFVVVLWWGNSQIKKSLEIKTQILEQISFFDGNKNSFNTLSAKTLSPNLIVNKNELDNKIRNILSQNGIDQHKVTLNNFHQISSSSNIEKIEAEVSFTDFGTSDFSNFIRSLLDSERFKILQVKLEKNVETNLLMGTLSLLHLGQTPYEPGETE